MLHRGGSRGGALQGANVDRRGDTIAAVFSISDSINFFTLNPYSTTNNFTDDNGWASYNGLQVQLRKAFSHGLTWTSNYTFSKSLTLTEPDGQTGASASRRPGSTNFAILPIGW